MKNIILLALLISSLPLLNGCAYINKRSPTQSEAEKLSDASSGIAKGVAGCRELKARDFGSAESKLEAVFEFDWNQNMENYPEWATYVGDPRGQDRLTDRSKAAIEQRREEERCLLELVKSIKREDLSESVMRTNYDLFLRNVAESVEGHTFPSEHLLLTQMGGPHQSMAQLLGAMRSQNVEDFENRIARLERFPESLRQSVQLLQEGLSKGITPPQKTLGTIPAQMDQLLIEDEKKNALMSSFQDMPNLKPEDQKRIRAKAWKTIRESVLPALREYRNFVATKYIPGARTTLAATDLPNGKAWYNYSIRTQTTLQLTAEEIHQIGLKETARLDREMLEAMKATGFKGTKAKFFNFLRTDRRFFFSDGEDLLREYRNIAKRADPALASIFSRLPRLPYGVKKIPGYMERESPTAYYEPGSPEAGRPAWYLANTYNLKARPRWEMEALTLHETVPGHHIQIALAQEIEHLPRFRREGSYTAFVEGWALYAESLGTEMGFYKDPYARVGKIAYEMWRANRLVVDTGIHALGWSRQKAVDFMIEHTPKAKHDLEVEVDRYIVWPGQALAYKLGELKIQELRKRAHSALGSNFDIRQFHDQVLNEGAVPLDLLDRKISTWIETQGGKTLPANSN